MGNTNWNPAVTVIMGGISQEAIIYPSALELASQALDRVAMLEKKVERLERKTSIIGWIVRWLWRKNG